MSFSIRHGISPSRAKGAANIKERQTMIEAMGLLLVSIIKSAFSGPHRLLRKSGDVAEHPHYPAHR